MKRKRRLNEMSPELLYRAANKQSKLLKNDAYLKKISAWQYIKSLKRIDDFRKYAEQIVNAINLGNVGSPEDNAVPERELRRNNNVPVSNDDTDSEIISFDPSDSVEEIGDEVASVLTNDRIDNLPDLVADVHDDESTVDSFDGYVYTGEGIDGNTWTGVKSSYREMYDSISRSLKLDTISYPVKIVTEVNPEGTDTIVNDNQYKFNWNIFKYALRRGVIHFVYTKLNKWKNPAGERQAFGTTNEKIIAQNGFSDKLNPDWETEHDPNEDYYNKNQNIIKYFDLTAGEWRTFRSKSVLLIYDESYEE
jgi:hypothetical protein